MDRGRGYPEAHVEVGLLPRSARDLPLHPAPLSGPLAVIRDGVLHQPQAAAVLGELVLQQAPLVVLTHLVPRAGLPGEVVTQRGADLFPSPRIAHFLVPAPGDNLPVDVPEVERIPAKPGHHQGSPVQLLLEKHPELDHERVVVAVLSILRPIVQPRALVVGG